jgi:hypothetical protein
MGIDHGGFDIFMPQEFLDCADIIAILKEMGGKAMAKGVTANLLVDFSLVNCSLDGFLQPAFM